ncbi:MAG: hypothetical protein ACQESR_05920 [Planctomycetota bacterium]
MNYRILLLGACGLIVWGVTSTNQAEEPRLLPRAGVLVLRTGSVLRGKILRVGDRYVVGLNDRDEVTVRADRVQMRCDSLQEAYRWKQSQLPENAKAADHLQLADWCLRHDCLAAAAEQLMAAQRQSPNGPANEHFEKRLRLAARRRPASSKGREVGHRVPSRAELDDVASSLPTGMVELFTNRVQPLLINHCGTGNCHGPAADSKFRLVLPTDSNSLPRGFTQTNLKMALGFVDAEQPGQSELLTRATEAHGGHSKPALRDGDVDQLQHLAAWVHGSKQAPNRPEPAVLDAPNKVLSQPLEPRNSHLADPSPSARGSSGTNANSDPPKNSDAPPKNADASRVQPVQHLESVESPSSSNAPPASDTPEGVDPFDPAVFNRRYLK